MREETVRKHDIFLKHCDQIMTNYVGYTLLDALIVGIANAAFMLVCGIPYVGLISVIVAVTNLLPTFGPVIGAIVGGLLLLLHNPVQALYFLGFTIVLQTLDGYVIKPKLFSGSLGVPSILVLVSVVVGGELFGVTGIILAIPFAAIIAYIYNDILFPALLRRKERLEAPENE
jgi:predicted PurR-regulated permease PerM